ncbi:uncharacterized protein B0H18DRAFT_1122877 [Fomitopsis serialis]|uniref:uncharacterized protein n=1 Tax=Fomitopsis serialis TaxID=139415 RepID=UPI00200897CE|nr:uncharacterized protein B0H18DRAFT_1122877 [Neoantrodia serialis]KAH9918801.1 hypothetical protein B0H18DRAFT_1122877 [Neoantrodia serialis]
MPHLDPTSEAYAARYYRLLEVLKTEGLVEPRYDANSPGEWLAWAHGVRWMIRFLFESRSWAILLANDTLPAPRSFPEIDELMRYLDEVFHRDGNQGDILGSPYPTIAWSETLVLLEQVNQAERRPLANPQYQRELLILSDFRQLPDNLESMGRAIHNIAVDQRRTHGTLVRLLESLLERVNTDRGFDAGAQPGDRVGLIEMSTEYRDSYHKLSDETKEELKEEVQDARESRQMGFRLNQRGRLADANNVWKQITELLKGLKARVGIEAMVLMVRNNHEFTMDPRWYITASQINDYLGTNFKGWDLEKIGALVEAFSVAGCDFMSFYRTAREKAEHLKKLIRQKILEGLATITGELNIQMNYINYEQEIVFRRGVILRGWLLSEFKNPSELSTSIPPLKAQWQALQSGACHWEKTTPEEREKLKASFAEKLAGGQVKKRKEHSDKGKKHVRPKKSRAKGKGKEAATAAAVATAGGDVEKESSDDDESGDDGEGQSRKCRRVAEPKSAEFVPDDVDD